MNSIFNILIGVQILFFIFRGIRFLLLFGWVVNASTGTVKERKSPRLPHNFHTLYLITILEVRERGQSETALKT